MQFTRKKIVLSKELLSHANDVQRQDFMVKNEQFMILLTSEGITHCPGTPDSRNTEVWTESCFTGQKGRVSCFSETAWSSTQIEKITSWSQCGNKLRLRTMCDQQSRSTLQLLFSAHACYVLGYKRRWLVNQEAQEGVTDTALVPFTHIHINIQRHHLHSSRSKTEQKDSARKEALTLRRENQL